MPPGLARLAPYACAVAFVALAVVARFAADLVAPGAIRITSFLLAVVASVLVGGMGPGILALVLGAGAAGSFFAEPSWSQILARPADAFSLALLGAIGVSLIWAGHRIRAAQARALRAAERLRVAQEAGGIGAWEHDLATGARHWSEGTYRLWGLAPGTPITPDLLLSLVHPEDRERARAVVAEAGQRVGSLPEPEFRIVRRSDGAVRWLVSRAQAIADERGRPVRHIGIMRDITAQKEAEAALAESERRNREVLESLGELLYALDAEGRVRFASRAALRAWGMPAEALLGRRFVEAFPQAAGSATWEAVQRAQHSREEVHLCGVSPLFGRWIEVDAYPNAGGGITVAFRDVEERRLSHRERVRAEKALRASEERLRLALDAAALGAWEVDLRAGVATRSPRTLEIFGYGSEAQVAAYPSWRDRIHPGDRDAALGPIEAARAGQIEAYRIAYRFHRPDGRWIWVESHGRVVERDPATGAALRIAGTTQDITERKAAEERQALLMRELDHRAKNTLAVVQAALRLTPKDDPEAYARAVEGRVAALARAHTLLAGGRWEGAGLRALLEAELAAFLPAPRLGAGEGGPGAAAASPLPQVEAEGPPLTLAPAATQALSMALHELATNATKHGALSAPGGRVSVSWRVDGPAGLLRLRWCERGGPRIATTPPSRRGFGSRVIEATVRDQLGGRIERHWDAEGLVCEIAAPVTRTLARSSAAAGAAAPPRTAPWCDPSA